MPEYVYALHDFLPEHEDEVSFHAGERIEVVEKDDLYGDGWWQGRNLAGKVGLFPQSYTAAAPPNTSTPESMTLSSSTDSSTTATEASRTPLQPLQEDSESESPTPNNDNNSSTTASIHAPQPQSQAPAIFLNGNSTEPEDEPASHKRTLSSGEEVMAATMTDVQQAIEQLGRRRNGSVGADGDEARSFSFMSSRGYGTEGTDTETDMELDIDMSDVDGADSAGAGESWHKGARTKLAEKARRAVQEAEKLEAMMNGGANGSGRSVAPPIEVELSDESEDEGDVNGDFTSHSHSGMFTRVHPHIPEEEEEEDQPHVVVPERDEDEARTATNTSFPVFQPFPAPTPPATPPAAAEEPRLREIITNSNNNEQYRESLISLPSPTESFPSPEQSKHNSVTSASASGLSLPPLTASSVPTTLVEQSQNDVKEKEKTHPSEWDVAEVVEWLKGKGFDQDVCEKFTEQEITGDVLLELDVNLLKTEIGIMAFGKRMRIANAITDLRRPPSIVYSDHPANFNSLPNSNPNSYSNPPSVPNTPFTPASFHSQGQGQGGHHSRHVSQAYSHQSFPGSVNGGAPAGPPLHNNGTYAGMGFASPEPVYLMQQQQQGQQQQGMLEPAVMGVSASAPAINGNGRPAHLMLSPSDGALKASAVAVAVSDVPEEDEDRGVASESEVIPSTSMRRRLFGRSYDSASSKLDSASRHSKEGSVSLLNSPVVPDAKKGKDAKEKDGEKETEKDGEKEKEKEVEKEKEKERERDRDSLGSLRPRSKKSVDGGSTGKSAGDRLSIFGSTFSGTLGKGRKPPPRITSASEDGSLQKEKEKEKDRQGHTPHSMFTLPRLTSGSRSKSSADERPSSSSGPKPSPKPTPTFTSNPPTPKSPHKERDPGLLRKRTSSAPAPATEATRLAAVTGLKQGQSILEQIGESDFKGWMRKKGDRYSTWKLRYFVLKGPHLYCLRSNSPAETKIKGYVNIVGYKVTVDENVNPGRYGFRIEHEHDKTHYFSSDEKGAIRDWMKAIMKATIGRDYSKPVISSCNIPTIPLMVAQAMNPAPRPPSPTARAATQKALRRENTSQLSTRDARVLMGLSSPQEGGEERERGRLPSFFTSEAVDGDEVGSAGGASPRSPVTPAPARPSREMRRPVVTTEDTTIIEWANSHLPLSLQIRDPTGSLCGGLSLMRIAESIKGKPVSPPVLDSAFPQNSTDDKLEGLFQLFDFLLDNDVKMGSVSINDVRSGKRDKILQLLRALKAWEEKRRALATSIASSVQSNGFAPVVWG
ncbi:hypothetical protein C0991_010835 [Blastosporella zonata]|nr:hypothetical protein C0991_010835 [Blastosporella zonata]